MSINLDPFLDSFFEESAEQIEALESGLLRVEGGGGSAELVDDLFRAAHTLKGNSATFGFRDVVSVTHRLEAILDQARERGGTLAPSAVQVLLGTVDGVRDMLARLRAKELRSEETVVALVEGLQRIVEGGDEASADPKRAGRASQGWAIEFVPHPQMMGRGNDPTLIFRALERLGSLTVEADVSALPSLGALDPSTCYIRWVLTLEGDIPRDLVDEVFEWVIDDCGLIVEPLQVVASAVQPPPVSPASAAPATVAAVSTASPDVAPLASATPGRLREGGEEEARTTASGGDVNAVRIAVDKVDRLINLVGQLAVTRSVLDRAVEGLPEPLRASFLDGLEGLARHTRDLQESVLEIRMLPLSFVTRRLPRVVRDLSRVLGKEVDLRVLGEETELDKSVLERISDPLTHIVRNCLDHGMETPARRQAVGKPPRGTIEIRASHQQGRVVIEIADDGPGIDCEKVLAAARRRGVPGLTDDMPRERVLDLVFQAGLSTADAVSEVSGRGVGLDVVRQNVYALGGALDVESMPGAGTRFTLLLPLTLAIIDGQFVRAGTETLIVPLVSIVECLPLDRTRFRSMAGQRGLYRFRDAYLPVARLDHLLGLEGADSEGGRIILVVEWGVERRAVVVDALLEQQQVVVKSLERNFRDIDGVIGGAILGDGGIGLIVDVAGLVRQKFAALQEAGRSQAIERREGFSMRVGNSS